MQNPLITNDLVSFGILAGVLGLIFYTQSLPGKFWRKFYAIIPGLFLAYMIPAVLVWLGIIGETWKVVENGTPVEYHSKLYYVATRLLLPASLILLTLSIDLKAIARLGWRALFMFFSGTTGIIIGGPVALALIGFFFPGLISAGGDDATWRGLATLAGSWIGGGANQAAMLEIFHYNRELYGGMVLVDIVVANVWMALLLIGINYRDKFNRWVKADTSSIEELKNKVVEFTRRNQRIPVLRDYMVILGLVFFTVSLAYLGAEWISESLKNIFPAIAGKSSKLSTLGKHFFWLITLATLAGVSFSFTPVKKLEGAGASKIGSVFIYFLVATIGMKIDLSKMLDRPELILVGVTWMFIHALVLIIAAKISRSPYFFLAVGSQANVGGAASAPVVAAAFHPALASVGALLAIFGYVVGTYGAWITALLMQWVTELMQ
jgi:uncharacterized membrane protein